MLAAFALLILGVLRLGWGFDELSALFFAMGLAAGLVAGLGWSGTADAFVTGFRSMAGAAMLVGFLIHVPVPSVSGQAVLTIPILVRLADLLGLSRQVTVLAYQYGAGLCDIITPTNGGMMAILAAAGVPFNKWLRFVLPLWGALLGLGVVAIVAGIALGLR